MRATIVRKSAAGAVLGALALAFALPAVADPLPSYAVGATDETIHGTVSAVNGPYDISVRDDRGFVDNVTLHQGTIINPTGLTLAPGQTVTIHGHAEGSAFSANQIDTPYRSYAAVPLYPAYAYPAYPYYGYAYPPYPLYAARFGFGRHGFGFGFGI